MSTVRVYRFMNLGIGDANEGKYGKLGSPFAICDDCLPMYDPAITNNIDCRLIEDVEVKTTEPCSYYAHNTRIRQGAPR